LRRSFEDAKARADKALALDPTSIDAQILRGNALAGLKDLNGAIAEYETAISQDPTRQEAYIGLGALQFAQGNRSAAEEAFRGAVASAPKSMAARMAQANFYWSTGDGPSAEAALKAALDVEPDNIGANRALGVFYVANGRAAEAEPYFKTIAATPRAAVEKLSLAQYYVAMKRSDDARGVLRGLANDNEFYVRASVRLAALDAQEGRTAEAQTRIREVLDRYPNDVAALLLNATLLLKTGQRDEALAAVTNALASDPQSAGAYWLAGRAQEARDRNADAIRAYEEVLKLERRSVAASLALARLHLVAGATDKALSYAQQALVVHPRHPDVHNLLARIYLRRSEIDKAKVEIATLEKMIPNSAAVYDLAGLLNEAAKRNDAARASYTRALQVSSNNIEALEGLTRLDVAAGRSKDAVARLDSAVQTQPDVNLMLFAARMHAAVGNRDKAETLLREAIKTEPAWISPYAQLGAFYQSQNRLEEARRQFERVLELDPKSVRASTTLAMLLEAQGRRAEAEKQYRMTLDIDPRAGVAANNLAYLYLTDNRNLDQALQLAQTAKQLLPEDASVSDTLGWLFVKKNLASLGIDALEASVKKMPANPVFHYHLGMAYFQTGEGDKAKRALQKALSLKTDFEGASEARTALLKIG
jgi:tetratricopeptide (TPR) repeat protein